MDTQAQIDELKAEINSLKSSQTIPSSVDQAFRERFKIGTFASVTINFASTDAQESTDSSFTVAGATIGDIVMLGIDNAAMTGIGTYTAWVSATDTVTIRFSNPQTVGALNPGSGVFTVGIIKKQ